VTRKQETSLGDAALKTILKSWASFHNLLNSSRTNCKQSFWFKLHNSKNKTRKMYLIMHEKLITIWYKSTCFLSDMPISNCDFCLYLL
jgi:hypothetical protein